MKTLVFAAALSVFSSLAHAQIQLTPDLKSTVAIATVLKGVTFYGTTFLPEAHCNTATVENPDQLQVLQVKGKDMTVVVCPGTLDGEENVVTIFSKSLPPQASKVKPPPSSSRVSEEQIKDLIAKLEAKPAPVQVETADVHKSSTADFEACLKSTKRQSPGFYVGETFSKASSNRGMFEAMTLYACHAGNEVLFNPENRIQMVYAAAKVSWLNAACEKKRTIDIPDVVPKTQASYVMVVRCGLLNNLLNSAAK